jgi:hypothetical protein
MNTGMKASFAINGGMYEVYNHNTAEIMDVGSIKGSRLQAQITIGKSPRDVNVENDGQGQRTNE